MLEKSTVKNFEEAIKFAEKFRYKDDLKQKSIQDYDLDKEKLHHSYNYLKITKSVTPEIYKNLLSVFDKLNIDKNFVEAFIFPDPQIQAECISSGRGECILRFSSGLIDLLDNEEIQFVAGHELGHYLLNHQGCADLGNNNNNIEDLINRRAQEISADRIGYIVSNSIDTSLQALMKTISGLGNKHIHFNFSDFINQINKISTKDIKYMSNSTHPSIIVRCKALLHFSMQDRGSTSKDVDSIIRKDMDSYDNAYERNILDDLNNEYFFWLLAENIVEKGSFKKPDQSKMIEEFGDKKIMSLCNLLSNSDIDKATEIIKRNVTNARNEYNVSAPISYDTESQNIQDKVKNFFDEEDNS